MSLILCRQEQVTFPYYIEELGVHIYSSQELCYVIYNHPLLVMENFVDDRLAEFIRTELRMPFLAERIEKWLDSRGMSDDLLFLILQECDYYSPQEPMMSTQSGEPTIFTDCPFTEKPFPCMRRFWKARKSASSPVNLRERSGTILRHVIQSCSVTRKPCMPMTVHGMRRASAFI